MQVAQFSGEYDAIAPLYDRTPAELADRDAAAQQVTERWVAWQEGIAVGAALARARPDSKVFLTFVGETRAAGSLAANVQAALGCVVYTTADEGAQDLVGSLGEVGFRTYLTTDVFMVPFSSALQSLRHSPLPTGFTTVAATDANPDLLFALDNAVRSRVPGTEGWRGNRTWFDSELADPAAYRVAIDLATGGYAGLARIWRNPDGPRFGLVGVTEAHRRTRLGPALIRLVLEEAASWGHSSFAAETALENQYLHHRLERIATRRVGRRMQLVLGHTTNA